VSRVIGGEAGAAGAAVEARLLEGPRSGLASVCRRLFFWAVVLNIADLLTTYLVIRAGGIESNPVMEPLVGGVWGAVAVKALCLLVVGLLVRDTHSRRVRNALVGVDAWYAVVVVWNLSILFRL
jgi:hypothetical protein